MLSLLVWLPIVGAVAVAFAPRSLSVLNTTTGSWRESLRRRFRVVSPSISGISRSSTTMSGFKNSSFSRAILPFEAMPTTSMSLSPFKASVTTLRSRAFASRFRHAIGIR